MKNSNYSRNKLKKAREPKSEAAKTVFRTLFLCTILGVAAVSIWVGFWVYDVLAETPPLNPSLVFPTGTTLIFDEEGEIIYETGISRHEWVSFNDISPVMIDAILAIEDSRFFDHHGVDWSRTVQAVRYTGQNLLTGVDSMQGGSTLTQQLINQTHLFDETGQRVTTLDRKVQEVMLSIQLERVFSKEQIIEAYLNISPFGGNIFGVQSAAQFYFGVDANRLTLAQAATLAGIVQAPSMHNPDRNAPQTQIRRDEVLNMMVRHGFIEQEQHDLASAVPVTDLLNYSDVNDDIERYRPFIDRVLEEADERFGIEPTGGYRIYTTLNREVQGFVFDLLNTNDHFIWPNPEIQTAVAMIANDGRIRALAGRELGVEQVDRGFNLPVHMERQPGSTSKPIWAYGPAFEYLDWGTGTMINDELFGYDGSNPGSIIVRNWDNIYRGRVSVRYSMERSWNVPAIKAYQAVVDLDEGETMERFVNSLGIPTTPVYGFNQRYAIGGMRYGVSPLQMAGAYAAFPNEGVFNEPFTITRIIAPDGTIIYGEDYHRSERVMSEGSAYMMNSILRTSVSGHGTGGRAQVPGQWIAGKTGTTNFDEAILNAFPSIRANNGVPDAWFVGYSMEYTVALWTGHQHISDGSFLPFGDQGQAIPQRLFAIIMGRFNTAGERQPVRPETVVSRSVEWQSGENDGEACLPSAATPRGFTRQELFHAHAQPTCTSDRFTGTGTGTEELEAPTDFNVTAGGGTTLNFTWEHDIGGHLSMSLEAATEALDRAVSQTRGQTHITQALLDLDPGEAEARMIIDGINAGAQENPIEYVVIATHINGSTRELVTSEGDSAEYILSRSDLVTLQSFHVIARLSRGGVNSEPSNIVLFNMDLVDESALSITIPNMDGWSRSQVEQWLRTNEITDYEFVEAYSDTVEIGHVITTNPTGTMAIDQSLLITISRGPEHDLPDIPGLPGDPSDGIDDPSDGPDQPIDPNSLFDLSPGLDGVINVGYFNQYGSWDTTRIFAAVLERVRRSGF